MLDAENSENDGCRMLILEFVHRNKHAMSCDLQASLAWVPPDGHPGAESSTPRMPKRMNFNGQAFANIA